MEKVETKGDSPDDVRRGENSSVDETRRTCSRWLKRARPAEDLVAGEFPELAEIAGSSCQSQDGSKLAAHLGKLASLYREIINRLSFRPRNTRLCWQKCHCNFYASREIFLYPAKLDCCSQETSENCEISSQLAAYAIMVV